MKTQRRPIPNLKRADGKVDGKSGTASAATADSAKNMNDFGRVGGVTPSTKEDERVFIWYVEDGARHNYSQLGQELANANNKLYRNGTNGHGLISVLANSKWRLIAKAQQLAPLIVDSLSMRVVKNGKVSSELPTAAHLNAVLRSEQFLKHFPPVDQVTTSVLYDDDFAIVQPGYNDVGADKRWLFLGATPPVLDSLDVINRFLDVMDFYSPADRANAVAAALTVLLRYQWLGQKPLILIRQRYLSFILVCSKGVRQG